MPRNSALVLYYPIKLPLLLTFYVFGSCFRALVVILVSVFFVVVVVLLFCFSYLAVFCLQRFYDGASFGVI